MRHDAETRGGNVNSAVLRLVNQCTTYSAPFIVFLGKNDRRFAHILHNPIANYFEIAGYEGAYFRFSTVNDHMYVSNLYSMDEVPYALQSYAYSKSESDDKFALKSEIGNVDLSNCLTSNSTEFILLNTCKISTENKLQISATERFLISSSGYGNINCQETLNFAGVKGINFGSSGVIGFSTPYRLYDTITESNYVT